MLEHLEMTRTKAIAVAAAATVVVGGFAVAWASTGSPSPTGQLSSSETAGDVSGNCDEPEHAGDADCAGIVTIESGAPTSSTTTSSTSTSTSTSSTVPTSTVTTVATGQTTGPAVAPSETHSFAAADAGTVTYTVQGGTFALVSATPTAGWRVDVEQASGSEIDLDFRSGTRRVQVDVEFEDGAVRERVRLRDDADDSRTEVVNGQNTGDDDHDDDRDDDHDDDRDDDRDDDSSDRPGSGHGSDD